MVVPWFETTTKYISGYIYQWKLLLTGVLWNSCYKYFKKIIKKHPLPSRFLLARTSWQVFSRKIYRKFKKCFFIKTPLEFCFYELLVKNEINFQFVSKEISKIIVLFFLSSLCIYVIPTTLFWMKIYNAFQYFLKTEEERTQYQKSELQNSNVCSQKRFQISFFRITFT